MFETLLAWIGERLEQFSRWQAQDYLNHQLARCIGDQRSKKYEWQLHSRNDSCSWRQLMWGDNHQHLVAYTTVWYANRDVIVGGWFSYGPIASVEGVFPPLYVHTAVLSDVPTCTRDWQRKPALFETPGEFATLVLRG